MVWPLDFTPDSLEVTFPYIQHMVGREIGLQREPDLWDYEETQIVQEIIDQGIRWAYYPTGIDKPYNQKTDFHQWTFMRPESELTTVADQQEYALPDDFEFMIGRPAYSQDDDNTYLPLKWTNPGRIRELANQRNYTAAPEWAAELAQTSSGDATQKWAVLFYPIPDSTYTITYQYQSTGLRLTEEHPYPMGGPAFASCVLAACLAAAEYRKTGQHGPQWAEFERELQVAMDRDRRRGARTVGGGRVPHIIGRGTTRRMGGLYYQNVLYNGVEY